MSRALARPSRGMSDDLLAQAAEWVEPAEEPITEQGAWTLADLKRAASYAAARVRTPRRFICESDPRRLAESAIGYAIAVDPDLPFGEAVNIGQREILEAAQVAMRDRGYSRKLGRPSDRYYAYWLDVIQPYPEPSRIEGAMTLASVLADLTPRHLDTMLLVAWTDSTAEAAEAAGVPIKTMRERARVARKAALALWFDGETPPSLTTWHSRRIATAEACPQGHPYDHENTRWIKVPGRRRARLCRTCLTERSAA